MVTTSWAAGTPATTRLFDVAALRRGIERGDVEALAALYDEDATLEVIDTTTPPSAPRVLRGVRAIRRFHDDISCRDMDHRLEHVIVDARGAAFLERCEYPDGPRVAVASTMELRRGRITRQVLVQSWDG